MENNWTPYDHEPGNTPRPTGGKHKASGNGCLPLVVAAIFVFCFVAVVGVNIGRSVT